MTTSDLVIKRTGGSQTHPLSFLDRFMRFIQGLTLPYWLTYLTLFFLEGLVIHILAWALGVLPVFRINKLYLLYPFWLWTPMAIMTYLNRIAETALSSFSSLMDVSEEELAQMRREFTTLPTRGIILSAVLWDIVYVVLNILSVDLLKASGFTGVLGVVGILAGFISYTLGSAIYYHSIRQLWLVYGTLKRVGHFDLFNLAPVYAFSRLTARTGIGWMILLAFTLMVFPLQFARGLVILTLVFQVVLATAAFVLPLRIVNQSLVLEKRRLLSNVNQRIKQLTERMHHHLDENEIDAAEQCSNTLLGLSAERDIVSSLSTWPWPPGLLTGFLSAIVLPIVLLLIQIGIEKLMAR